MKLCEKLNQIKNDAIINFTHWCMYIENNDIDAGDLGNKPFHDFLNILNKLDLARWENDD